MNALQHTLPMTALTARLPMAHQAVACLELSLPAGWQLLGGSGCRLELLRGDLWLTDARQKDILLEVGSSTLLAQRALASAEADSLLRLYPGETASPDVMLCPIRQQVRVITHQRVFKEAMRNLWA